MSPPPRLPRSFDRETGELVDADGVSRILSDDEMARYWETEAIAATKGDAPEAAAHAQGKATFYRKRAKATRKQKASENKNPK